ncbi:7934_t:CDS:2 [Dentiscutata erythropus]|uniref:7934_t:CDS:1 n=1 Tax=Dentiscutata erythropus TaxID=1348616 RepID=A0A9N9EK93_9GLOM|nr:7934_t:CDS:2 [Dentiscutata erythropus]
MNSRLFYILIKDKAKSLKYLKHLPDKLKGPEQLPANEIFDPLSENIQINNDLFVGNLTRKELLAAIPESPILEKLNNDNELSLAMYLNDAILNEAFTDSFVNYLLTELRLNKHPFKLRLQPDFSFSVSDKDVSAKAEFSIKENSMILIDNIRSLRKKTEYGESQISAEILACAFTNFDHAISPTTGESQTVYAMRVIGTNFTFYKAFLSRDYLKSLHQGFPPHNLSVTISRFPPNDSQKTRFGHDYADKDHRFLIIDLLYRLKECLFKM